MNLIRQKSAPLVILFLFACLASFSLPIRSAEQAVGDKEQVKMNRYMITGVSTQEVYASIVKEPQDRTVGARKLMETAGCRLVDYYFGINDYKMYIIVDCPDEGTLGSLLFLFMANGALAEGTASATRLVSGSDAVGIMEGASKLSGSYATPK